MPRRSGQQIGDLNHRVQGAVLMDRAAYEPLRPPNNVWLAFRELLIEAVSHQVLSAPKRRVLPVNHHQRQPRTGSFGFLYQCCVSHPKPQAVDLERILRRQADGQDARLVDESDVFQSVSVEGASSSLCAHIPPPCKLDPLCIERDALTGHQVPSLDLKLSGTAAQFGANEVSPAALSASKPSGRYQYPPATT